MKVMSGPSSKRQIMISAISLLMFAAQGLCQQVAESSIYNFAGPVSGDGAVSYASLVFDEAGNLYGTTFQGGTGNCPDKTGKVIGCGTVFELSQIGGTWVLSNRYDFQGGDDGEQPMGPVTLDSAGNIYGTTMSGGGQGACYTYRVLVGCGTLYRLTPNASGGWTKSVIHAFNNLDGAFPQGGLIFDKAGNLFGTTFAGALYQGGNVFEVTHSGSGWSFASIYDFGTNSNDGNLPMAGVIIDGHGNLYGTTTYGGRSTCDCGIAYKLTHTASGWKEVILHRFAGGLADGAYPYAPLLLDPTGLLYGAAVGGGVQGCLAYGCGTLFALSRTSSGTWKETQLHRFAGGPEDGGLPFGFVQDSTGTLYGSTYLEGAFGNGTVFKFSPTGGTLSVLYSFQGGSGDGARPAAAVTLDSAGNLFGTTSRAGKYGLGTVFELTQ